MGFTVEDMMLVSENRYRMKLIAGRQGWSNSISWLLMLEDFTIIHNFRGKELAVTTGLGFQSEEAFMMLLEQLTSAHAAGLIVNVGRYINDFSEEVLAFCDEHDFPLLTVPWDVYLADMIKDLSIRVFLQGTTDEEISKALIQAIDSPEEQGRYMKVLLPYFDVDGTFQAVVLYKEGLDSMDTVERKRIAYRLQINMTNLTHNAHFFYYDSVFVVVINAVETDTVRKIIKGFEKNLRKRMPRSGFVIGIGSQVTDITHLRSTYKRARAAALRAVSEQSGMVEFDQMGIFRLLYSVEDRALLSQMSDELLAPLLEYDQKHDSDYVKTLDSYLRNDGSIQAVSEDLFIHRNTISYRMTKIRSLLNSELDTPMEKMPYQLACLIRQM
ncbi:MAG: PucR family transcriptional regulator ligand-binding domain-containing protein [Lachnospiraceae bacterium]|nr:PucR family transcriptional regulator ligand-binding domain-containing protein [Lachnospiraceae bacterium]